MKTFANLAGYLRYPISLIIILTLPFFILVRGAVYFYHFGWTGYLALLLSSFVTIIILLVYLIAMDRWITKKELVPFKQKLIIVVTVVLLFNASALLFFSNENAKTETIADGFRRVHPLLRIAVNTVMILDESILVTDTDRFKKDYTKMGLSPKEKSLHYRQKDGYVHAIDLRTKGKLRLRNWFIEGLFKLLGFHTYRHTGTADHLHVALPMVKT